MMRALSSFCCLIALVVSMPTPSGQSSFLERRDAEEPLAQYGDDAAYTTHHRGCYNSKREQREQHSTEKPAFTEAELAIASNSPSIDWRKRGAVTSVQQQHPFGTCWAFAATAVLEGTAVVQGHKPLEKLSEQFVVSCQPPSSGGQDPNVQWGYLRKHYQGRMQTETSYGYNRTCNFFREQLLAPDGTRDGYLMNCTLPDMPPVGPCPPCPGITRKDGAPPCHASTGTFSKHAHVRGWVHVPNGKHGGQTKVVAALAKYGPGAVSVDATCLTGYKGGIITNCTRSLKQTDHAVTIVGAETDSASGVEYFIVKNSWGTAFGEGGFFRVQRNTGQLGLGDSYFALY